MPQEVIETTGEIVRKKNLFELGQQLEAVFDSLDQVDGEFTPEIESAITAWLESVDLDLDQKIDAYCSLIDKFNAHASIRKAESDRLAAMAKVDLNNAKRLKDRMKQFMEFTGNQKMETKYRKLRLQNNGGALPIQWIAKDGDFITVLPDEPSIDSLPPEDVVQIPSIDMEAIRSDLEGGVELSFARLCDRGQHLRIS